MKPTAMTIYEDHARINIADDKKRQQLSLMLLHTQKFEDVVLGIEELCVKFDPEYIGEEEVQRLITHHMAIDNSNEINTSQHHILPVSFNKDDALDIAYVSSLMNKNEEQFIHWFLHQNFHVQMMGFQPGFAYISHNAVAPEIDRLGTPRAKVSAGSIGFLGKSACIYAHDGPGGWPIIGKVEKSIFNVAHNPPNLLNSGDKITFEKS